MGKVLTAHTRLGKSAWQKLDRAANPGKYRLAEAKRYLSHEMQKDRRKLARRYAFGPMSDELRDARRVFALDECDMSVWDRMLAVMHWRIQVPKDDRVGDSAYRWLKKASHIIRNSPA